PLYRRHRQRARRRRLQRLRRRQKCLAGAGAKHGPRAIARRHPRRARGNRRRHRYRVHPQQLPRTRPAQTAGRYPRSGGDRRSLFPANAAAALGLDARDGFKTLARDLVRHEETQGRRPMPPQVEFHFDFGSPNAYLAHRVIPAIAARTGVAFTYVPILLGGVFKLTNNQSPMLQFKGIKNKLEYQRLEVTRFLKAHGLSRFAMNPHFPVNTVQIMRGAIWAQDTGAFERYVEAVFVAMWEAGSKLDDPEVIRTTLDAAGLDGGDMLGAIQEQRIKDQLIKNTE